MSLPPIAEHCPQICAALANHAMVILEAPPGAGKSTYLPLQLLTEASLAHGKILLLEPRRLAARSVAAFLAAQLGESVGKSVGLRMRQETKVSQHTRLEVVTEGVLTRMLQSDPELNGVSLVIFDEFHERSLHADLGLALSYDVQQGLRDDLKLLVMSATLEGMPLTERFPDAALIQCQGRSYPVALHYQSRDRHLPLAPQLAALTEQALLAHSGSALIFLPGVYEIQKLQQVLSARISAHPILAKAPIDIVALYGTLSAAEQSRAIAPAATGRRKVVLATNVAETSLTIDGISLVIDSGLYRQARYHPRIGHTRLDTMEISQASATQRAGRAGRLMPGVAYRLWAEALQSRRPQQSLPEIATADLTAMVLELAIWGVQQPDALHWLQPPAEALWRAAVERLQRIDAVDDEGRVTAHGRALADLGGAPELAHMLIWAQQHGQNMEGCLASAVAVAALVEERLPNQFGDDLSRWLSWLSSSGAPHQELRHRLHLRCRQLWHALAASGTVWQAQAIDHSLTGLLLALASPGWLAAKRGEGYLAAHGFGLKLAVDSHWQGQPLLAVATIRDSHSGDPTVALAAPLSWEVLAEHCPHWFDLRTQIGWDPRLGRVTATEGRYLQALPVETRSIAVAIDDPRWQQGVLAGIAQRGVAKLPWTPALRQWQQRVLMAAEHFPEASWPDLSDAALAADWQWLQPFLTGVRHPDKLTSAQLSQALKSHLPWSLSQQLDLNFPCHWQAPTGSQVPIQYELGKAPRIAVRIQEMYGQHTSPRVGRDLPVVVELLSPAGRPLQVTQDLAAFWAGSYQQVQKEMKGRYPKHFWPDDPANAQATTKTKRAMNNH